MRSLKWSMSHAVFVPEIDDEHREIFEAVSKLEEALSSRDLPVIRELTQRLVTCTVEHFAHEERLMRAARYESLRWHKRQHIAARKNVRQFVVGIEQGDAQAGVALVDYLKSWLPKHTRLPDRMMGAFLRNRQRCLFKVSFMAGTRPADACAWVDSNGKKLDPLGRKSRS